MAYLLRVLVQQDRELLCRVLPHLERIHVLGPFPQSQTVISTASLKI
jgi:hypothetical protein